MERAAVYLVIFPLGDFLLDLEIVGKQKRWGEERIIVPSLL